MATVTGNTPELAPPQRRFEGTARWAVVQELKRLGTARNIDIARTLNLSPGAVGYVLHQLRVTGCAKRIKTGHYEFTCMPENLHYWDDGIDASNTPEIVGGTMPEKIINLVQQAPNGAISFTAIQKVLGLPRNITGAVLSDMVKHGQVVRVRRGLYRPQSNPAVN